MIANKRKNLALILLGVAIFLGLCSYAWQIVDISTKMGRITALEMAIWLWLGWGIFGSLVRVKAADENKEKLPIMKTIFLTVILGTLCGPANFVYGAKVLLENG